MSSILDLQTQVEYELSFSNLQFSERLERLLGVLRAEGIVPSMRTQLHYPLHRTFAGVVLLALDGCDSISCETISDSTLIAHGLPTQSMKWIEKAYAKGWMTLNGKEYFPHPKLHALVPYLTDSEVIVA